MLTASVGPETQSDPKSGDEGAKTQKHFDVMLAKALGWLMVALVSLPPCRATHTL